MSAAASRGGGAERGRASRRVAEGLLGGVAFGLADALATGPLRVPAGLSLVVVASGLGGGLAVGLLAAALRGPRGLAFALAVAGAFVLEGLAFASHDLRGGERLLFLAALAAAGGATLLVGARAFARRGGIASAWLLAASAPASELARRLFDVPGAAFVALSLPPLVALAVFVLPRAARAAGGLAVGALFLLAAPRPGSPIRDGSPAAALPPPGAPNVCLVVVDTLRADAADAARAAGDPSASVLARLAEEGVRFEQAVASAPWTLPSTASLLTALHPGQHGATDVDRPLARELETLAERFAAAGWDTAAFTGGAFLAPAFGLSQGFARFEPDAEYRYRLAPGHAPLVWHVLRNRWLPWRALVRWLDPFGGVGELRRRVERWLAERDDARPWFLFVHTYEVHDYYLYDAAVDEPLRRAGPAPFGRRLSVHPARLFELGQEELGWFERVYRARLAHVDRELAALLDLLERSDARPLVAALTSDHGEGFDAERGRVHHGGRLHDDLLRVPLLLRAPELAAGRVVAEQVRTLDLGPTLLELAGLSPPGDVAGRSLAPALAGREPWPSPAWSEERGELRALRAGRWKAVGAAGAMRYHDLGADPLELGSIPREAFPGELIDAWDGFAERFPARAVQSDAADTELDDATRSELKALGYLD